jgi:hypothetical protein
MVIIFAACAIFAFSYLDDITAVFTAYNTVMEAFCTITTQPFVAR